MSNSMMVEKPSGFRYAVRWENEQVTIDSGGGRVHRLTIEQLKEIVRFAETQRDDIANAESEVSE